MTATSIFFNGRTTVIPGSYTEINAAGLAVVGLGAIGVVAVLGEAEGGAPQTVYDIAVPGNVGRTFRSGDLLEAGNMLFEPSKDDRIPGGAALVKFIKVNPSTQSAISLPNIDGDALDIVSIDYGLFTTQISLSVSTGTTQGKLITVTDHTTGIVETYDNVGGDTVFSIQYTPGSTGADTMTVELDNTVGFSADFTKAETGLDTAYVGTVGGIVGLDGDADNPITAAATVTVVSSDNADSTQTVTVIGIVNGTGLPGTETIALNGTTPVPGATQWASVHGIVLSAVCAGNVTASDTGDSDPLFVIAAGQTITGGGVDDLSGETIENGGSTVTVVADGATTATLILVGTDEADVAQLEEVTLNGAVPVATTGKWNSIQYVAVGLVAAARTLTIEGLIWNSGDVARVVSNSASDTSQTITLYGVDTSGNGQTETLALNGLTAVTGTATWGAIYGASLSALTVGTTIAVSSGAAEAHAVSVFSFDGSASLYAGFAPISNLTMTGLLSVTDDSATALKFLVVGVNSSGVAAAEEVTCSNGTVNTSTSWAEITGLGLAHLPAGVTITLAGNAFDFSITDYPEVEDFASAVDSRGGWALTVNANGGTVDVANMDNVATVTAIGADVDFTGDLAFMIDTINNNSGLVSVSKSAGSTGVPSNTSGEVFLVGGIEGTTTFADWQAALTLLKAETVNTIVPLTDDAAVHAATVSHCVYMAGPGKKERDCVLGEESGITLTAAKAAALALNTRHARLLIQDIERFNVSGVREVFPPYFHACIAAGMQAGAGIGEPLTFKYTNVLDVVSDSTYNLVDNGEEIINSGILVQEKVDGKGFRWLRNVTTHLRDSNIAYVEASANQAVNYAAFNIRSNLEFVVGAKGTEGTVNAAISNVIKTLGLLASDDVAAIVAWRNLTVTLEADVLTVDVEIAPVSPVNFVKTTLNLVTASFAAAA